MFLVKQGDKSMLCMLDLGPFGPKEARENFDDELAILSGDSTINELIELAIATVGDDPEVWEPWFQQQRKARIHQSKAHKEGTP
jgi:type IV secretion system protein VirB4